MSSRLWGASLNGLRAGFPAGSAAPDVTAPVASLPVGTKTSSTTATIGATTDEASTMYSICSTSATAPTAVQVEAGQMHTGAAAAFAGSAAASIGANTISATGLTPATAYWSHTIFKDGAGNRSNVVTTAGSFTTDAATVLDGVNKGANWTLSNGNLTGTHTSSASGDIIRGTNGHSGSGDWSYTVTFSAGGPTIGLCNASAPTSASEVGGDSNSIGIAASDGIVYTNGGSPVATATSFSSANTITIRLKNGKLYIAKDGTYTLGNPVAETGGYDVSAMGALFPALSFVGSQNATFNFTGWP